MLSSATAPVLLIGGWTVAQRYQSAGFDPVTQTISALAALGAEDRWIMTSALTGVGVCHLASALGLREAATAGRRLLAVGGAATLLVAAIPLPADEGSSTGHAVAAAITFGSLSAWPALCWGRDSPAWALRRPAALTAAAGLLGLLGWFVVELSGGARVGLAERVAAGAQALWPLAAVLSSRRAQR